MSAALSPSPRLKRGGARTRAAQGASGAHDACAGRIPTQPPSSDPPATNFTAEAPDRLWVADITCPFPTWAGFFPYLAVALDAFSRRIGGVVDGHTPAGRVGARRARMVLYAREAPPPRAVHTTPPWNGDTSVLPDVAGAAGRRAGVPPWVRSGTATTTRCRELFRHAGVRAPRSPQFPHPGRGSAWRCSGSLEGFHNLRIVGTASRRSTCHPLTGRQQRTLGLKTQVLNSPRNRGKSNLPEIALRKDQPPRGSPPEG